MQSSKVISSWKVQFCSHEDGREETEEKNKISHAIFKSTFKKDLFELSQSYHRNCVYGA